ncbi:MAG: hypothetical protein KIT18_02980 [Burkholderiales bacterium]|nr:hypothetical protein [Burkholderiales bacterium]
MRSIFRRRFVAWTVLLAVLYAAVSPAVAAYAYAADPVAFAEICRTVDADAADTRQAPPPKAAHTVQCLFCISGTPPLPQAPVAVSAAVPFATYVTSLHADADRPYDASAYTPASPRAPPLA